MEPRLKLVTDSASDLPRYLQQKYDIEVVPLSVIFGETEFKDGVTITTEQFYEKLRSEPELPSTNQVNPHDFVKAFQPHLSEGNEILYIGLSHRLSGTFQSATLAREMLDGSRIHVFDSHSASLGESLYVVKAAELAMAGYSAADITAELEKHRKRAFGYVMLDALDHIVRGGRLSKAQGIVGSILQIKPVLTITPEGTVEVGEKVRTTKKALQSMIDKAREQNIDFSKETVAVAHSDAGDLFYEFVDMVTEQLRPKQIIQGLVGPTIGTHAGPGAVGLFF